MRSDAKTVAAYFASLPDERRHSLAQLRRLLKRAVPSLVEHMAYGHAIFDLRGRPLFALAAQKNYLAMYVAEVDVLARLRATLGVRDVAKSCIRFRHVDQLDLRGVEKLAREAARARSARPHGWPVATRAS